MGTVLEERQAIVQEMSQVRLLFRSGVERCRFEGRADRPFSLPSSLLARSRNHRRSMPKSPNSLKLSRGERLCLSHSLPPVPRSHAPRLLLRRRSRVETLTPLPSFNSASTNPRRTTTSSTSFSTTATSFALPRFSFSSTSARSSSRTNQQHPLLAVARTEAEMMSRDFLPQLLLRLDFGRWFSRGGAEEGEGDGGEVLGELRG